MVNFYAIRACRTQVRNESKPPEIQVFRLHEQSAVHSRSVIDYWFALTECCLPENSSHTSPDNSYRS
jgi:hypothetical protein